MYIKTYLRYIYIKLYNIKLNFILVKNNKICIYINLTHIKRN